jgi:hypothetical protein
MNFLLFLATTPTVPTLDLSNIDTTPMLTIIYQLIPVGIPIMLLLLGIRIGISTFRSMLSGGGNL